MARDCDWVAPLFVPGDRPERFAKAAQSGADAVILDLEDAVAPAAKAAAREAIVADFTDLPVIVRVNAPETPWHADDLAAVARLPFAAVMIPKSELGGALESVIERNLPLTVVALVESAKGLADARGVAALPGVARLVFGSIDFCADLGCAHTRQALLAARSELVLASRLGGKTAPVDGVTTSLEDAALIADDAAHSREMGFGGKLCIHPRQVEHVLPAFYPSEAEIEWAEKVLASGDGVARVDGAMVDEPVRIRARALIARARARRA